MKEPLPWSIPFLSTHSKLNWLMPGLLKNARWLLFNFMTTILSWDGFKFEWFKCINFLYSLLLLRQEFSSQWSLKIRINSELNTLKNQDLRTERNRNVGTELVYASLESILVWSAHWCCASLAQVHFILIFI